MNLELRRSYLRKKWKPYPDLFVGGSAGTHGRWALLKDKCKINARMEEDRELDPALILHPLDWIELIEAEDQVLVRLLAPYLLIEKSNFIRDRQSLDLAVDLSKFISKVREFFIRQNFVEVQTPTLVVCPGTEPFLDPFSTEFRMGSLRTEKYYLPTSPELHLKKMLTQGLDKIFELRPCFRNGEISFNHQPEFLMCEWYRAFEKLDKIKEDLKSMVCKLRPEGDKPDPHFITKTMAELFLEFVDFELKPSSTAEELRAVCERLKLDVGSSKSLSQNLANTFDDLFFFIYVAKIEPQLHQYPYLFIEKYPPSQAALARLTSDGWGDRFEFYIHGIEIANAFYELNDPTVQRARFSEDLRAKIQLNKEPVPLDEDFLLHLEAGLPPSSGVAMGVERLYMALYGIKDIKDARFFSIR